jgi:hypothetical protein
MPGSFRNPTLAAFPRRWALLAALGAACLVVLTVSALLTAGLWVDAQRWRAEAVTQRSNVLRQQQQLNQSLQEMEQMRTQLHEIQAENHDLEARAANPTLAIWNSCAHPCALASDRVLAGGVPDTFAFHVSYVSDVPVSLYFFSFHQWTQYDDCGFQASCVSGSYGYYPASRSRKVDFLDATGCAGYVFVMSAETAGTVTPDVKATYRPADHPTGICARST